MGIMGHASNLLNKGIVHKEAKPYSCEIRFYVKCFQFHTIEKKSMKLKPHLHISVLLIP